MSYVSSAIGPNETLVHEARLHWIIYVPGVLVAVLAGLAWAINVWIAGAFALIALYLLLGPVIRASTTELAVTSRKVVVKLGLISRQTIEQRIGKVDSVRVHQTVLGRLLNYGTIEVTGAGLSVAPVKNISNPIAFRRALEAAEEMRAQSGREED